MLNKGVSDGVFLLDFSEPAPAASLVGGPDLPLGPASLAGREVGGQKTSSEDKSES